MDTKELWPPLSSPHNDRAPRNPSLKTLGIWINNHQERVVYD
jgi:hypothetical protein